MNHIDWELVNWSRAQFALTAMYHWLFVPLTLGITFIIAIMETIAAHTGKCREFAFFEIENGKLISEKFKENLHAHHHEDGCCNHHHDSNEKKYHSHAEILNQLSGVDKFYYYGMGMGLRNELTENHINFEKAKYFEIGEIIENLNL